MTENEAIEEAPKKRGRPPKQGVMCEVLRDYWPTENEIDRVRKGTIVEVTPDEAMDGMEAGLLKRVK